MKYTEKLSKIKGCPPKALAIRTGPAFRFVFSDITHPHNFLPPGVLNPGRFVSANAHICCASYALSMYETKEQLIDRAKAALKSNPLFLKRIGDHVAELKLESSDGFGGKPDGRGHFDFFEGPDFLGQQRVIAVEKVEP